MTARTLLRSVASAALASFVLAGVALAADPSAPPTVGGSIDAYGDKHVVVTNLGNVQAHVTVASETVGLSESAFDIPAGDSHSFTYTGEPVGTIAATFTIDQNLVKTGDAGTATLVLGLKPYVPPPNYSAFIFGALILLALVFLTWRGVRWARRHIRFVPDPEVA